MKELKTVTFFFFGALMLLGFLYGSYWLAKNGSYWLWYEDMVRDTIREMVKQTSLKGG